MSENVKIADIDLHFKKYSDKLKRCRKNKGGIQMPPLQGQWLEALKPEFKKAYYKELFDKVGQDPSILNLLG